MKGSSFDWKDIVATIISGFLGYLIYQIIHKQENVN
jgi:uncharacterized membrane protein YjjP (DUF1212 family)